MKTIINIGRQFGSGGKSVALALGEKLGIKVYDGELLNRAAQESGFSREFFEKNDESRSLFTLSGLFDSARFGSADNYVGGNTLFSIQSDVIRSIAEKESAIFVGRCSDYILRDMDCVNVFICAPEEFRIAAVCKRSGLDTEAAAELMRKKDRRRETYYNYHTFGNWGVASNYHLCIDSSVLGVDGTVDMIIGYCNKRGLSGGQK